VGNATIGKRNGRGEGKGKGAARGVADNAWQRQPGENTVPYTMSSIFAKMGACVLKYDRKDRHREKGRENTAAPRY
jgi:hypothetical protein